MLGTLLDAGDTGLGGGRDGNYAAQSLAHSRRSWWVFGERVTALWPAAEAQALGSEGQKHPSSPLSSFRLVTPVIHSLHHHPAYPLEAGGAALDEPQLSRSWEWIKDL